jgi:diketogulonate reductase-like aldo/keto reductase
MFNLNAFSGGEIPLMQLGTCQLITKPNVDPNLPPGFIGMLPEHSYCQVELALQAGLRAFDTAYIYCSQIPIGHVLAEWWKMERLSTRDKDVWRTTKVFHL